jgi:hypothetical protein
MQYAFRIRFNRSPSSTLQTDLSEINISQPEANIALSLRAALAGESIKDAKQWALFGEGYTSADEAEEAGKRFQDTLMIALAKMRIGVDFGDLPPKGASAEYRLGVLVPGGQRRLLDDVHGLQVFLAEPKPIFIGVGIPTVISTQSLLSFQKEFGDATTQNRRLTDRERLAFSLFNASYFEARAESRLLLLVMAIEAIIDPLPKSRKAVQHVDRFIEEIKHSSLDPDERASLIGSSKWLRDESISKAGKRLVCERLGNKSYNDIAAPAFFSKVYSMRSKLVHGGTPFPTFSDISVMAGHLMEFVSDLLIAPSSFSAHKKHPRRAGLRIAFQGCRRKKYT